MGQLPGLQPRHRSSGGRPAGVSDLISRGEPRRRRDASARTRRPREKSRTGTGIVSGARRTLGPGGGHALGRRAADAGDRPLPHGRAGARHVRRAVAGLGACRRAAPAAHDPRPQPGRPHLRAGRTKRRGFAQARRPRLRAREWEDHALRNGRGAVGGRPRAARVSGALNSERWLYSALYAAGGTIVTVNWPTPSISHSSLSPGTVAATPDGVPVMMMSPAASSTISESLTLHVAR